LRRLRIGAILAVVALTPACLDEIRRAADELREFALPTIVRLPDEFDLPHCRAAMGEVRRMLDRGVRFAIVDRLPLAELGADAATAIYWLLSSMVARPVAQSLDGKLIYDVRDTGRQALPGSGVRPDQTNIELKFHTDNSYNATPPDYVVLLCLTQVQRGGREHWPSLHRDRRQVGLQDKLTGCRGIHARPLSQRELQVLKASAGPVSPPDNVPASA